MKKNSRLSAVLHALMHMAERDAPMTSDDLALCLDTNAVVVRRTMAGLRDAGIVQSGRGHGGGWVFARPLAEISLLDIYHALGEPIVFQIGPATESPGCVVEQSVNRVVGDALKDAEAILMARFAQTRLSDLAADFGAAAKARRALTDTG
ncbi:BadM/Rrf2 family transcriptional regulator [Rhizobium subbaraonis]|uniref:BadM/Rrf2 family transcriptional regulator n=1 Tax=Rhizobium subbaraonis TaxID=908946 RepID=A0A285UCG0_9HYPH|nr:Rrf2 family transcriptional regulator [Rhizobium subbaraonis]SOC39489.1 BadM/Rrf2 family transcriptional regulator [Rhizobium subbaraonis]